MKPKIAIAIGGSSGAIYAKVLLDKLISIKDQVSRIDVVMTDNAKINWKLEMGDTSYEDYLFDLFDNKDFNAPFASGSAQYSAMIVCPCSMGLLARIANGISDDLITRAADVMLKERRKLILVPRETPFSLIHIKNMEFVSLAGGIICPAIPSFYNRPKTIDDLIATVIDRVIQLAGLNIDSYRWGE
ncbi:MAG TPA: UbiX family flavin prenyltransferase [Saprospiraceae bacterium]|nr:UbiX family flavin prenyltransferase [Saprospiraceae bacterium]